MDKVVRSCCREHIDYLLPQIEKLQADNKLLAETLERILHKGECGCERIAQEALAKVKEK